MVAGAEKSQRSLIIRRHCHKAKRIRFFKNGEQFFKGMWYAVSMERYRSFDALLNDLTTALDDMVNLPHGVRYIFSLDGRQKIFNVDEFQDGESYVCSSNDVFRKLDYANAKEPVWYNPRARRRNSQDSNSASINGMLETSMIAEPNDFVHPRIITVIRNGVKPRRVVRLLLNRKTAHSFEQVLCDITSAVKLLTGAVRKIYGISGKQVTCLADFFCDEYIFIAYGNEKLSIDDFYLDMEEYKFLYSRKCRHVIDIDFCNKVSRVPLNPAYARNNMRPSVRSGNAVPTSHESPARRNKFLDQKFRNQRKLRPCNENGLDSPSACTSLTQSQCSSDEPCSSTHPPFILEKFDIGRQIGDGNFAVVHECSHRRTGEAMALKIIDRAKCSGKEEMVDQEVSLLRQMNHEHIVRLLGYWDAVDRYYIAMEYINGGDLFDTMIEMRQLKESDARNLMRCLADALTYLHSNLIIHRDIKAENLLVYRSPDNKLLLKVADFGLAAVVTDLNQQLYNLCGTPIYVAPEILAETGYGYKVDVWAAGVILYIMLCGFPPFASLNNGQDELFENILTGCYNFPSPYWDPISGAAKGLIQGMLQLDVEDRYSASEVLMHPWITGKQKMLMDVCNGVEFADDDDDRYSVVSSASGEYNQLAKLPSNASALEFFYSRRRSMDDFCTSQASFILMNGHDIDHRTVELGEDDN